MSDEFPHHKYTLGYAGRPGGATAFYVSTIDNRNNHGGDRKGEPDAIFGKLLPSSYPVVKRMQTQPGGKKPNGFVSSNANFIKIKTLELLSGDDRDAARRGPASESGQEAAPGAPAPGRRR